MKTINQLPLATELHANDLFVIDRQNPDGTRTTYSVPAEVVVVAPTPVPTGLNYDDASQTLRIQGLGIQPDTVVLINGYLPAASRAYTFTPVSGGLYEPRLDLILFAPLPPGTHVITIANSFRQTLLNLTV